VAYKMALVAAGRIDATWTLVPKHEWDVAAGVALVFAAGGEVWSPADEPLAFNQRRPRFSGLAASTRGLHPALRVLLGDCLKNQRASPARDERTTPPAP
jgi:myo-inositol-1(or 4)-monophosphatase